MRYCLLACAIAGVLGAFTCTLGTIMSSTTEIKQEWLLSLQNLCGREFEMDENGNLIPNKVMLYNLTMAN